MGASGVNELKRKKYNFGLSRGKNCSNYRIMLDYIEMYYKGNIESKARFEIKTWNVNQRVLSGLRRTSNKLERFNRAFYSDWRLSSGNSRYNRKYSIRAKFN